VHASGAAARTSVSFSGRRREGRVGAISSSALRALMTRRLARGALLMLWPARATRSGALPGVASACRRRQPRSNVSTACKAAARPVG
jgi:hypothetical protein